MPTRLRRSGPARRLAAPAGDSAAGARRARRSTSLRGVGPALDKKLAQARAAHGARPARAPAAPLRDGRAASGGSPSCCGEEEVAIAGEVRSVSVRRPRRNLAIVNARRRATRAARSSRVWFNQPGSRRSCSPGRTCGCAASWGATASRSRRTTSTARGDGRLRAGLSRPARRCTPQRLRGLVERALPARARPARPAAGRAEAARGAAAAARRALRRCTARARSRRRRRGRRRLAFDELLLLQVGLARRAARARGGGRAGARRAGRADRALPRGAAVRAHARTRSGRSREIDGDLARDGADAAAAAGRRRLRQDGGRALRAAARGRERAAGRADGADRDARRAALPDDRGALRASSASRCRAADELGRQARARRARRDDRRRHARADPGGRRAARPRGRGRRRAAPLRRRAARGAGRGPRAARPAHDRDADPAHARADASTATSPCPRSRSRRRRASRS